MDQRGMLFQRGLENFGQSIARGMEVKAEQNKRLNKNAKIADAFMRTNPEALEQLGTEMDTFASWSAQDKTAAMEGVLAGAGYQKAQADMAKFEQEVEYSQDPISGKRFATFGNQMIPAGNDPSVFDGGGAMSLQDEAEMAYTQARTRKINQELSEGSGEGGVIRNRKKRALAELKALKANGATDAKIGRDGSVSTGFLTFGESPIDQLIAGLEAELGGRQSNSSPNSSPNGQSRGEVRVKDPYGNLGWLAQSDIEEALTKGFTRVQ